jgi:hypothetical protein
MHSLDPMEEEPKLEAQVDQAEEANLEHKTEQGKARCILKLCFMFYLIMH